MIDPRTFKRISDLMQQRLKLATVPPCPRCGDTRPTTRAISLRGDIPRDSCLSCETEWSLFDDLKKEKDDDKM